MKSFTSIRYLLLALTLAIAQVCPSCLEVHPKQGSGSAPSHEMWDGLLKKHVKSNGLVDYNGFSSDIDTLKYYLKVLEENAPNETTWSKEEQLAYWINAYNAFTVALVLEHYPIASIKDIGGKLQVPFINSPWDIKFITINGEQFDLNDIEHRIIRKKFDEPRIHFALNCASISCPDLRPEAYTATLLYSQLNDQAHQFLNDTSKNIIGKAKLELSMIFLWYRGDFIKNTTLLGFVSQYTKVKPSEDANVSYLDYNWGLNEVKE